MCFKSSAPASIPIQEEKVEIHKADASQTKNNANEDSSGYKQNFKTTAIGLTDNATVEKHTLLGE